ncbi:MAG: hypothetical protein ABSB60_08685 [Terracidiphilus sp.]|jgi:hypothetical protein
MMVKFKTDEILAEKSALMEFQFLCITQLFPCRSEREILPADWLMLDARY